jgi:hypothetical protein
MKYVTLMYTDPEHTKAMSKIAERLLDDHVTAVELRSVHDSVER